MATIDHSTCTHPRTPAGRAKCRADRKKAPQVAVDTTPEVMSLPAYEAAIGELNAATMARAGDGFTQERKAIRAKVAKAAATPAVAAKLAEAAKAAPIDEIKIAVGILRDINSDQDMKPEARARANEGLAIREGIEGRPCCDMCGNFRYDEGVTDVTTDGACGPSFCAFAIATR